MAHVFVRHGGASLMILIFSGFALPPARAQSPDAEIETLKRQMQELLRHNAEQQRQIEQLQRQVDDLRNQAAAAPTPRTAESALDAAVEAAQKDEPGARGDKAAETALDEAVRDVQQPAQPSDVWSRQIGGGRLRLIDVSFDVLAAAGTSTAPTSELMELEGGHHDPNRRGFTLQQAELSLSGAVDPYFTAEAHVVFVPDGVELEESFFTTQSLPYGLQLEGGYFLTEFGIVNPLHAHAWEWLDQPVINSRLFGGEGLRAPGFRLGWLTPLPWFSEVHFGMQNADEGETTLSFISDEGVGGRPVIDRSIKSLQDLLYLARWNNSWNLSDDWTALLGFSGLYGPNATGRDAQTWVYGGDLKVRWRPPDNFRGWPFLIWQTEAMKRDYTADSFPADDLPRDILRDWGLYTQVLYGFRPGWAAGTRFEYASGHSDSVIDGALASRSGDPFRDDRYRVSPLLVWQPTEYSRFRLQYNYDDAPHLEHGDAHTVWLGGEVLYGAHPAHRY